MKKLFLLIIISLWSTMARASVITYIKEATETAATAVFAYIMLLYGEQKGYYNLPDWTHFHSYH